MHVFLPADRTDISQLMESFVNTQQGTIKGTRSVEFRTIWIDLESHHTIGALVTSILDRCRSYDRRLPRVVLPTGPAADSPNSDEENPDDYVSPQMQKGVRKVHEALSRGKYRLVLDWIGSYARPETVHHGVAAAGASIALLRVQELHLFLTDLLGCRQQYLRFRLYFRESARSGPATQSDPSQAEPAELRNERRAWIDLSQEEFRQEMKSHPEYHTFSKFAVEAKQSILKVGRKLRESIILMGMSRSVSRFTTGSDQGRTELQDIDSELDCISTFLRLLTLDSASTAESFRPEPLLVHEPDRTHSPIESDSATEQLLLPPSFLRWSDRTPSGNGRELSEYAHFDHHHWDSALVAGATVSLMCFFRRPRHAQMLRSVVRQVLRAFRGSESHEILQQRSSRHRTEGITPNGKQLTRLEDMMVQFLEDCGSLQPVNADCPSSLARIVTCLEGGYYWLRGDVRNRMYDAVTNCTQRQNIQEAFQFRRKDAKEQNLAQLRITLRQLCFTVLLHEIIARYLYSELYLASRDIETFFDYLYHRISSIRYIAALEAFLRSSGGQYALREVFSETLPDTGHTEWQLWFQSFCRHMGLQRSGENEAATLDFRTLCRSLTAQLAKRRQDNIRAVSQVFQRDRDSLLCLVSSDRLIGWLQWISTNDLCRMRTSWYKPSQKENTTGAQTRRLDYRDSCDGLLQDFHDELASFHARVLREKTDFFGSADIHLRQMFSILAPEPSRFRFQIVRFDAVNRKDLARRFNIYSLRVVDTRRGPALSEVLKSILESAGDDTDLSRIDETTKSLFPGSDDEADFRKYFQNDADKAELQPLRLKIALSLLKVTQTNQQHSPKESQLKSRLGEIVENAFSEVANANNHVTPRGNPQAQMDLGNIFRMLRELIDIGVCIGNGSSFEDAISVLDFTDRACQHIGLHLHQMSIARIPQQKIKEQLEKLRHLQVNLRFHEASLRLRRIDPWEEIAKLEGLSPDDTYPATQYETIERLCEEGLDLVRETEFKRPEKYLAFRSQFRTLLARLWSFRQQADLQLHDDAMAEFLRAEAGVDGMTAARRISLAVISIYRSEAAMLRSSAGFLQLVSRIAPRHERTSSAISLTGMETVWVYLLQRLNPQTLGGEIDGDEAAGINVTPGLNVDIRRIVNQQVQKLPLIGISHRNQQAIRRRFRTELTERLRLCVFDAICHRSDADLSSREREWIESDPLPYQISDLQTSGRPANGDVFSRISKPEVNGQYRHCLLAGVSEFEQQWPGRRIRSLVDNLNTNSTGSSLPRSDSAGNPASGHSTVRAIIPQTSFRDYLIAARKTDLASWPDDTLRTIHGAAERADEVAETLAQCRERLVRAETELGLAMNLLSSGRRNVWWWQQYYRLEAQIQVEWLLFSLSGDESGQIGDSTPRSVLRTERVKRGLRAIRSGLDHIYYRDSPS
ncbi:MAG: hypothetical protein KDA96_16295, partial [Planctomycetaceae bacterium]|nr:hypothetical protein [Planctomycetaceae bacterium]